MKTDDQIRELALKAYPVYLDGDVYDENEEIRIGWVLGFQSAQSSLEAEIERRANEKVEEWKKGVLQKLQQIDWSLANGNNIGRIYIQLERLLHPKEGEGI
jgi:hypothetical protein